ncbi:1-acyl-sn-glycerol-3-phosphate acyltransferase [Tahibacter aquaticus]|uniref:1-acyl-sn-glycerol-3-phosphate acyltransferase n=1 Tax=Tahibacter aquaticus TaxID=520092 RepID=A0A4R6YV53_9GAMM|nr:lysophospholipid acyltransferase family protein [Tahibacter aquaticus]TDR42551.1 1-acyl-sn-glycerol-3-phosphate acyltransferase [Tahibacter aquaticus]
MWISRAGWSVLNMLQLIFTLAWTAGLIGVAFVVLLVTRQRRLPLRMAARCWVPGLLWGSGAKLVVRGVDRVDWTRPHVVVANHQSMMDICVLFRAIPVPLQFLLKQELSRLPLVGAYAKAMGMIFVERSSAREATKRMREAAQLVKAGATLCVFPEGTRSHDGEVLPFKSGAFQIALDSGADVVPVAIEGSGKVLSLGGLFRVRPGTITVTIGAPLRTVEIADRQLLAAQARESVVALKREAA